MKLPALKKALELNEAGNIIDSFKDGYRDAERRHAAASRAQRTAQRQTGTRPVVRTPAAKKPSKAEIMKAVTDDLTQYTQDFFTKFPNYGDDHGGAEGILANHPTPEARAAAATAYKNLSNRVAELRKGFNKSIVKSGLATLEQVKKFNDGAKKMAGSQAPSVPQALIKFVRKEAPFFIRLVKINNSAELNDRDFKNLLALKIKQTSPERVPDAVQALNLLFGYMESEFAAQAKVISAAQSAIDTSEREAQIAARNASPMQTTTESTVKIKELLELLEGVKVKHSGMMNEAKAPADMKGLAKVDVEYDEDDNEYTGTIWLKCKSAEEFHKLLQGDSKVAGYVDRELSKADANDGNDDLVLMAIEDYDEPTKEGDGFVMHFRHNGSTHGGYNGYNKDKW